ncbi:MAG TPA: hypothetical protein VFL85_02385 [Candidatus Saccharimonadales bacterium]|nr:hypothetical protein [Candidatus Saccharimonadales bacterium]
MKAIHKYYIGLGVIGAFALVMLIVVVSQGVSARQDNDTYRQATKVADKLNSYVDKNQKVPDSLADAGITDAPSTVSYTKKAADRYEFCVQYKSASDGMNMTDATSTLTEKAAEQYYGYGDVSGSSSSNDYSSYLDSELYLPDAHKAGRNCQTIKPYIQPTTCVPSSFGSSQSLNDYYSCLDSQQSSDPYGSSSGYQAL